MRLRLMPLLMLVMPLAACTVGPNYHAASPATLVTFRLAPFSST